MLLQLVPPETVEETRSSTVRAAASIMLLGLGFACLAAILIDLLAQRRTKRNGAGGVEQTPNSLAASSHRRVTNRQTGRSRSRRWRPLSSSSHATPSHRVDGIPCAALRNPGVSCAPGVRRSRRASVAHGPGHAVAIDARAVFPQLSEPRQPPPAKQLNPITVALASYVVMVLVAWTSGKLRPLSSLAGTTSDRALITVASLAGLALFVATAYARNG